MATNSIVAGDASVAGVLGAVLSLVGVLRVGLLLLDSTRGVRDGVGHVAGLVLELPVRAVVAPLLSSQPVSNLLLGDGLAIIRRRLGRGCCG